MTRTVALLRGINVGGKTPVPMAELRDLAGGLGLAEPQTLLQSGNLVFASAAKAADLETALEAEAKKRFGRAIDFFVRSAREWAGIVAGNPYAEEAKRDPGHLVAMVLRDAPSAAAAEALRAAIKGREAFTVKGRTAWIVYPDGIGRSKLTNALIEGKLKARGTARNWNTVLRIAALLKA